MYDLYLAEQYLKTLKTWIAFNVFYIVFAIGVYVLFAYLLMLRGRKAGVSTDWQAYVPFARELYKMKMLDVSLWKMLFFGDFVLLFTAMALGGIVLSVYSSQVWAYIIAFLLLSYLVFAIIFNVIYYKKLYKSFGFSAAAVLARYFCIPLAIVVDSVIALDDRVRFKDSAAEGSASFTSAAATSKPRLYGVTGIFSGSSFDLSERDEIVLGRDPKECNIVFDQSQASISRKHCGIKLDAATGKAVITNYSKNGVFIGSGQLPGNMTVSVDKGTEFYLGTPENKFRIV